MAGIGFELRKTLASQSISSMLTAWGYSLALSSGPYIITIVSLLLINFLFYGLVEKPFTIVQFQITVTYIIAFSLIYSSFSTLFITRFVSDRVFEKRFEKILPNVMGIIILNTISSFLLSLVFSLSLLWQSVNLLFAVLFSLTFSLFTGLWIAYIVLISLKEYKFTLLSFAISYILFLPIALVLMRFGMEFLLLSFFMANSLLLSLLLLRLVYLFYSDRLFSLDFLQERKYRLYTLTGLLYNLGIWADKIVFWFNPETGTPVLGPFRYSVFYDVPVFLAYLSIAPGMAVLFIKVEGEFAEHYERYYDAVRGGAVLEKIYLYGNYLISSARSVILDTIRIQGIFAVLIIVFEEVIFTLLKLPKIYMPLFNILLFGSIFLLSLLSVLAMLFYFDRQREAFLVGLTFFVSNFVFSIITQALGPTFYGYGYALSALLSSIISVILLRRFLNELHYYTFMHI